MPAEYQKVCGFLPQPELVMAGVAMKIVSCWHTEILRKILHKVKMWKILRKWPLRHHYGTVMTIMVVNHDALR